MRSMAFSELKTFVARPPRIRTILVGLGVLVCAVLILLWQLEQVALVQIIITVILGGGGLYVALRQLMETKKSNSVGQANVRVAQEGHLTEGFTQAIEHLGSDKIEIRVGGIYALERIAKDSEKDHGPIMEVLTAYVRENAPRQEEDTQNGAEKSPTDIQAILTVLGRRETTGKNRGNAPLDLSGTRLVRADLTDANLSGAILVEADLRRAYLTRANLAEADLLRANLSGALLTKAENLTAKQVRSARNWREAHLPDYLAHLKDLPDPPA